VLARSFSLQRELHPTTADAPTSTSFAVTNPATAETITHLETTPIASLDEVFQAMLQPLLTALLCKLTM
jgi:hypothetical protein